MPPIKSALESPHFLSFSAAIQTRLTACLRSDPAHIGTFSPASDADAIEAIKAGLNKVQPKNPPMQRITDPQGTYGQSMADNVLTYKSLNGIIRPGQKLDNVVGRMTLTRLDDELKNLGNPEPKPPAPLEFGSTNWRFSFFCRRSGIFSTTSQYELFIASTEAQDSGTFRVDSPFHSGDLGMRFQGETRGTFKTPKKVLAAQFGKQSFALFNITRFSQTLQGSMRIVLGIENQTSFQFFLGRFKDESSGFTDGTVNVNGSLVPRKPGE